MNQKDLIRQAAMVVLFALAAFLSDMSSSGDPRRTVLHNLRVGSYAVLAIAGLLCLKSFFTGDHKAKGLPDLSVKSVLVYVYGLGLLVFVTVYCLLDLGQARYFYVAAWSGIAAEDVLERYAERWPRKTLFFLCNALSLAAFVGRALVAPDMYEAIEAFLAGNYYVFVFGLVLPMCSPLIYLAIRHKRFYNPITVMEFIHLSMPFAVHTSVSTLLSLSLMEPTADSQPIFLLFNLSANETGRPTNATAALIPASLVTQERLVTAADVATPLLVLIMVPILFFAVQTTLLYSIADFLCPAALVMSAKHFALNQNADASTVFIFMSASGAFCARVYMCFNDRDDYAGVLYSEEGQNRAREYSEDPDLLRSLQEIAVLDADSP
jgi:hypothetical protein